jgi:hypothetical protein
LSSVVKLEDNAGIPLEFFRPLDDGLHDVSHTLLKLVASYDTSVSDLNTVITKVDGIQCILGNRCDEIHEEFQAPTLWGTIASLATYITKTRDICAKFEPKLESANADIIRLFDDKKNYILRDDGKSMSHRVDILRDTVIKLCESVTANTKRSFNSMETLYAEMEDIRNVRTRFNPASSLSPASNHVPVEIKDQLERIAKTNDELKIMFRNLSAQADREGKVLQSWVQNLPGRCCLG